MVKPIPHNNVTPYTWFNELGLEINVAAEFDDSALLKLFGQQEHGAFCAPTSIEGHVSEQYRVQVLGRTEQIQESIYLISPERKVKNAHVLELINAAKQLI